MPTPVTAADALDSAERHIALEGTYNLRDTGGYPVLDASGAVVGRTRWGTLLRSDALHRLTEADLAALAERGVRLVVDLRDAREVEGWPSRLDGLDVTVEHLPVFADAAPAALLSGRIDLATLYDAMVDDRGDTLTRAVAALARAGDGASIVHCTAGKDRTGIVVALALLAVGVDRETVIEDYARTEANLAGEWLEEMVSMVSRYGVPDTPELRVLMGGSPREAIEGVIETIERAHGSTREYLLASGLRLADLAALERLLIDPEG